MKDIKEEMKREKEIKRLEEEEERIRGLEEERTGEIKPNSAKRVGGAWPSGQDA